MKTIKTISLLICLFIMGVAKSQVRDTIVSVQGEKVHFDYDLSWSAQTFGKKLIEFRANSLVTSFRTSSSIISLLNQIPASGNACINGGFENGYTEWTGLSLNHRARTLPIENGLGASPGIAPLPFTGLSSGQNHTSIETTGLDPIISVASPSFPLQKTATGTTGTQSLRLGNDSPGYGAEGVAKRFVVTAENAKYYFQYAIVMDKSHSNADGSVNGTEAFFIAEATDMTGATIDKVVEIANPSNPFISATNGGSKYYRDWRCIYLDLSSHIGQEVVVMFINSDCSRGGHEGYTYVDDVCEECSDVNGIDIEVDIDLVANGCLSFPQTGISGSFIIPASATNLNINLEIYQSNVLVNTVSTPTIIGTNYSFTLSGSDFPDQTTGQCYDLVAVISVDLVNLNGNVVTTTKRSSREVLGSQDGEIPGYNNDVCFCEPPPSDEGAYCCGDSNLVSNGNFEFGNQDFNSSYTQDATTFPGQYNVTGDASVFGANVTDHSFCADSTAYAANDKFLLINGKTQQSGSSVIWEQTLSGLEVGEEYKFCANFKDMEQCTFNILPKVTIKADSVSSSQSINTDDSDPCDWEKLEICFVASSTSMNLQIELDETGNGDGNDLAIDDISVSKLLDPDLNISVLHQGEPQRITGSINTINSTDDVLPYDTAICNDPWYWFVAVVDSFSGGVININTSTEPYGWGNDTGYGLFNPGTSGTTPWDLTSDFPNFPFAQNTIYLVGMYTPSCCEECLGEGFTYQLTFNDDVRITPNAQLSQSDKDFIMAMLGTYGSPPQPPHMSKTGMFETSKLNVYPNSATNLVKVSLENKIVNQVVITKMNGNIVKSITYKNSNAAQDINVKGLASGIYLVKATATDGSTHISKLLIK